MIAKIANKFALLMYASRLGNMRPFLGLEMLTRAFTGCGGNCQRWAFFSTGRG